MKNPSTFFFFLLALFSFSVEAQDYLKMSVPSEMKAYANSTVRLDHTKITVKAIDDLEYFSKRVVTVFNKEGNQDLDTYLYYSGIQKVKNIEARLYDANGNEIEKFKERDFSETSAYDGFSLYTDSRVYRLDFTPSSYPYTLVFEYEVNQNSTAFLPKWYPLTNSLQSVEKSIFEVNNETDSKLNYKLLNEDRYEDIELTYDETNIKIEANLLPAFKYESYNASIFNFAPHALIGLESFHLEGIDAKIKSWQEFGIWKYENLLKGRDEIPEATQQEIEALVAGVTSPKEKAKIIYNYVQNKMRYVSVQIGLGSWMPITAAEVDQVKYGDCKGLTNYTKALLNHVGVPANYTLIYSDRNKKDIYKDLVALQGNHVILNLPLEGEDVWLECTSQNFPFGFIGVGNDDRDALVITDQGGVIKHTPKLISENNYQHNKAEINMLADGTIYANLVRSSFGSQYQKQYLKDKENTNDIKEEYFKEWSHIRDLNILDFSFTNHKDEIRYVENVDIASRKFTKQVGNLIVFPLNIFNQSISKPQKYQNRTTPFAVERGFKNVDEYTFNLPEAYEVDTLPENVDLSTVFGTYTLKIQQVEGQILYTRELILNNAYYSINQYEEFRDFLTQVELNDQSKVIIKQKS